MFLKKKLLAVVCIVLVLGVLFGCAPQQTPSQTSSQQSSPQETSSFSIWKTKTVTKTSQRPSLLTDVFFTQKDAANGFYTDLNAADFSGIQALFQEGKIKIDKRTTLIGAGFNMHFADFVTVNGEIWAYYITWEEHQGKSKGCIALAKSTDGITFTDCGTVLHAGESGWDSTMATFPGVWYEDGTFYLVYEGSGDVYGQIGLATSTDGIHFKKYGKNGLLLENSGESHEKVNIGTPDLIRVNGVWYLTYHSFDGVDCQICLAYGTDLRSLTKYEYNPILPTSAQGSDSGTTGRRDLVYYDGWFYMVYEISTDQPYDAAVWGHKFARSKDLSNWELVESPYMLTTGGMGNDGPSFCVIDGKLWIYYREAGNFLGRYCIQAKK